MTYNLRITYNVKIAKWRIDDQTIIENREWSLMVYDRNLEKWVYVNECDRPGESITIDSIEILDETS